MRCERSDGPTASFRLEKPPRHSEKTRSAPKEPSIFQVRGRVTLYRRRPTNRWAGRFGKSCGAPPMQLFEGCRPWVWRPLCQLHRLWPQKPCQTGSFAKRLLLMFIDILLPCNHLRDLIPAPSVLQEKSSDGKSSDAVSITRARVCREAASFQRARRKRTRFEESKPVASAYDPW
jgi:hypothetical protein